MLRKMMLLLGVTLLAVFLASCETNDSASDTASAQNMQPNLTGYTVQTTDNYTDALAAVAGTSAVLTGQPWTAAGIERVSTALECLQDAGAVSAYIYTRTDEGIIPQMGVSLVINQTRVERNILSCLADSPLSAQAEFSIEFCPATGTFTQQDENFYFAYFGFGDQICTGFQTHFQSLSATFTE